MRVMRQSRGNSRATARGFGRSALALHDARTAAATGVVALSDALSTTKAAIGKVVVVGRKIAARLALYEQVRWAGARLRHTVAGKAHPCAPPI